MTEFTTTKIGDRWFLRSEEKDIAIDEILWISRESASGRFEVSMKRGMACWATPAKPRQFHEFGKFTEAGGRYANACIHCHAKWPNNDDCSDKPQGEPVKPSRQQTAGPLAVANPQFSDELNRHYAKDKPSNPQPKSASCCECNKCDECPKPVSCGLCFGCANPGAGKPYGC